jgi:YjjG family noncanonical pyrimidine nucleotidase
MKNVKTIFFDLDNTLFDHNAAERAANEILFRRYQMLLGSVELDEWVRIYSEENLRLWKQMSEGAVSPSDLRVLRFSNTLLRLGCSTALAEELAREYVTIYSSQKFACPNVHAILEHLEGRYELGILSNGFAEIQGDKLALLGISHFFRHVIYSDTVGAMKPGLEIFQAAQHAARRQPEEVVYVGDSYNDDVLGAKRAGWKAILYNPSKEVIENGIADAEIADLLELKEIF